MKANSFYLFFITFLALTNISQADSASPSPLSEQQTSAQETTSTQSAPQWEQIGDGWKKIGNVTFSPDVLKLGTTIPTAWELSSDNIADTAQMYLEARQVSNGHASAKILEDGSIQLSGGRRYGGILYRGLSRRNHPYNHITLADLGGSPAVALFATPKGMVARLKNGSYYVWGLGYNEKSGRLCNNYGSKCKKIISLRQHEVGLLFSDESYYNYFTLDTNLESYGATLNLDEGGILNLLTDGNITINIDPFTDRITPITTDRITPITTDRITPITTDLNSRVVWHHKLKKNVYVVLENGTSYIFSPMYVNGKQLPLIEGSPIIQLDIVQNPWDKTFVGTAYTANGEKYPYDSSYPYYDQDSALVACYDSYYDQDRDPYYGYRPYYSYDYPYHW